MISRWKLFLPSLALTSLLGFFALAFAVPPQKRIVSKLSRPNEPVQLIAIRDRGKAVEFGKPFAGRNDWLGSLTFVIKNTSNRSVLWARVALSFRKEKEPDVRLNDSVAYGIGRWDIDKLRGGGPPLKPGETAEVSYSLEQYDSIREILDGMGYPRSIKQIEASVDQVIFADRPELMWIEGTMNEFHSPTGWRPVKP
jgi:hypothetical protein